VKAPVIAIAVTISVFAFAGPAWAHAGEEEEPAAVRIEEGIAIIATQPNQMDAIDDKIGDALDSEDQDGVDVVVLKKAQAAFEDGDLDSTLVLLEGSLGVQPGQLMTDATTGQPSPAPVPPSQESRESPLRAAGAHRLPGAQAAGLLVLAVGSMSVGLVVARRFR
jgi:hypothetical protein